MSATDFFSGAGLSRYSLMARLRPALLVLAPAIPVIAYWLPEVRTAAGAAGGVVTAIGVTFFLSTVSRRFGRDLEESMGDRVGRRHSALLLTFSDATIAGETKKRYHAFLKAKGCKLSTPDEEHADPQTALERARSAVDHLLALTKIPKQDPRLLDETIAYGFVRNLRGLKPLAVGLLVVVLLANGFLIALDRRDPSVLTYGGSIEGCLAIVLAAWTFFVTKRSVGVASLSYARCFFERCEGPKTTRRAAPSGS